MPIDFPGNAANYPANVRSLQDGEHVNEANVGVTASDASDRTAFLKSFVDPLAAEQLARPLMNFVRAPTVDAPRCAIWDGLGRCYVGLDNAGTPVVKWSVSHGQASDVPFETLTLTGAVAGESLTTAETDRFGNCVFAGGHSTIFSVAGGGAPNVVPVATRVTAIHVDGAREAPGLAHDHVRAKWLYIADANAGGGGSAVQTIRTSTDRVTWITPAGTTGSAGGDIKTCLATNRSTGRIVYLAVKEGTAGASVRVRVTDNCGTSFVAGSDLALGAGVVGPSGMALTWSDEYAKFFFTVYKNAACEVWTSTDGLVWTKIKTLSSLAIRRIESYGKALVAQMQAVNGYVGHAISTDQGVTWKLGAFMPQGVPKDLFRTAYGVASLIASSGGSVAHNAYFSHAAGTAVSNTLF